MKSCQQTERSRMTDTNTQTRRLALVIDADNAQPSLIQPVLLAAASRGRVTVRRIYGDWTSPNMASWKAHLLDHSIRPIQQFRIVGGKNATDSAMIIDAMDLLHSGLVDGFCIVSSDSDFTSLARRIQESGLFVMGVGRRTTPVAFQRACEEFVFTDDMHATPASKPAAAQRRRPAATAAAAQRPYALPNRRAARAQSAGRTDTRTAGAGHPLGHRRGDRLGRHRPRRADRAPVRTRLQQQGLRPRHAVRPAGKPARPVPAAQGRHRAGAGAADRKTGRSSGGSVFRKRARCAGQTAAQQAATQTAGGRNCGYRTGCRGCDGAGHRAPLEHARPGRWRRQARKNPRSPPQPCPQAAASGRRVTLRRALFEARPREPQGRFEAAMPGASAFSRTLIRAAGAAPCDLRGLLSAARRNHAVSTQSAA
jgi:hypothetical protein